MHSDLLEVSDVITLSIPNVLVQVLRELPVGSWQHWAAHTQQGLVSNVIWVKLLVMASPTFASVAGWVMMLESWSPVCRWDSAAGPPSELQGTLSEPVRMTWSYINLLKTRRTMDLVAASPLLYWGSLEVKSSNCSTLPVGQMLEPVSEETCLLFLRMYTELWLVCKHMHTCW